MEENTEAGERRKKEGKDRRRAERQRVRQGEREGEVMKQRKKMEKRASCSLRLFAITRVHLLKLTSLLALLKIEWLHSTKNRLCRSLCSFGLLCSFRYFIMKSRMPRHDSTESIQLLIVYVDVVLNDHSAKFISKCKSFSRQTGIQMVKPIIYAGRDAP